MWGVEAAGHLLGIFITGSFCYRSDTAIDEVMEPVRRCSAFTYRHGRRLMIEDKSIGNASDRAPSTVDISRNACAQREVEFAISNTFNPMLR